MGERVVRELVAEGRELRNSGLDATTDRARIHTDTRRGETVMEPIYWISGKQYDLRDADDRTAILDMIDENRNHEAVNSQTMVALVLMQDVERRYGPEVPHFEATLVDLSH